MCGMFKNCQRDKFSFHSKVRTNKVPDKSLSQSLSHRRFLHLLLVLVANFSAFSVKLNLACN